MKDNSKLLTRIFKDLNIKHEPEEGSLVWASRIIYSALGKQALNSLFDSVEDEESVSVSHLKNRITRNLDVYYDLYPELINVMGSPNDIADDIYDTYISSGYIYHSPYRLSPAIYRESNYSNVIFLRGVPFQESAFMSGLGQYRFIDNYKDDDIYNVFEMFKINSTHLNNRLISYSSNTIWESLNEDLQIEFLRLKPPFYDGYWTNEVDKTGDISLLRFKEGVNYIYYLYKYAGGVLLISGLKDWMFSDYNYREISNSILFSRGLLPKVICDRMDNLVKVRFEYLPPYDIYVFFKLYSWPCFDGLSNSSFERLMQKDIFMVFEKMLNNIGIGVG